MQDRETMDQVQGRQTENWNRANTRGTNIYMFDIEKIEEATCGVHKKDIGNYTRCIRHEVAHCFFWAKLNGNYFRVNRLNEGMSIYLSGQLVEKKMPEKFEQFLEFWDTAGNGVYNEAGFVIQFLIEKYGKEQILQLIKSLGTIFSKEEFFKIFKELYGFELTYENINKELL